MGTAVEKYLAELLELQTAGLAFGGADNPNPALQTAATEEYDGACLDIRWKFKYSKKRMVWQVEALKHLL
jgi:hypothetical protein